MIAAVGSTFLHAGVVGAKFHSADVRKAVFLEADLSDADFHLANMMEADLTRATALRTCFDEATLQNALLLGADIRGASLHRCNIGGAKLKACRVEDSALTHADNTEAASLSMRISDCFFCGHCGRNREAWGTKAGVEAHCKSQHPGLQPNPQSVPVEECCRQIRAAVEVSRAAWYRGLL